MKLRQSEDERARPLEAYEAHVPPLIVAFVVEVGISHAVLVLE